MKKLALGSRFIGSQIYSGGLRVVAATLRRCWIRRSGSPGSGGAFDFALSDAFLRRRDDEPSLSSRSEVVDSPPLSTECREGDPEIGDLRENRLRAGERET